MTWRRPSYKFKNKRCKALIIFKSQALFLKKGKKWDLPGGQIEFNETPDQCIKREIFEETGIVIPNLKIEKMKHGNTLFIVKLRLNPTIKLSPEHTDYKWINCDKIIKIKPLTNMVNTLLN